MATRGAKPKSAHLRIIDSTHRTNRHGDRDEAKKVAETATQQFGALTRPKHLKREALAAWKKYIEPASWLDGSREPAAIAFCELWQEFMDGPRVFAASKHGQMRAYMSELGLTDERNRLDKDDDEKRDEFFDD
jgi:phage terminase small subunit